MPGAAQLLDLIAESASPEAEFWASRVEQVIGSLLGVKEAFDRRGAPYPPGVVVGGDVYYLTDHLSELPDKEPLVVGNVRGPEGLDAQLYFRRADWVLQGILTLWLRPNA